MRKYKERADVQGIEAKTRGRMEGKVEDSVEEKRTDAVSGS
jgi:hypothetical protein